MKVIAGCPTYDGTRHNTQALMALHAAGVRVFEMRGLSLLTRSFNECLAFAMNEGATHWLLLHADIIPVSEDWPRRLMEVMLDHKADLLSVVMPIKTANHLTSTAIETGDPWNPRKLTLKEVSERPETWTEPGLLVNTGLMLLRLRAEWGGALCFTMHDRIVRRHNALIVQCQPEDWNFSRQVRGLGGKVCATRAIRAIHVGTDHWKNWLE